MKSDQPSFLSRPDMPEGLIYGPDFLSEAEEAALAGRMDVLPFKPFEFHGFLGKRQTVSFGWSYKFDGSGLGEADPIPDWLLPVRARAAAFAGLAPEALEHSLLIKYEDGAGLGWHRDRPVFGDVLGISLLSPAPQGRRQMAALRPPCRAALHLPSARARPHRMGAQPYARKGPALLDHVPDAGLRSSLRGAQRRGNPGGAGLLRYARNDGTRQL
jgi:alkylated DNA repair dioxygenase AlkB